MSKKDLNSGTYKSTEDAPEGNAEVDERRRLRISKALGIIVRSFEKVEAIEIDENFVVHVVVDEKNGWQRLSLQLTDERNISTRYPCLRVYGNDKKNRGLVEIIYGSKPSRRQVPVTNNQLYRDIPSIVSLCVREYLQEANKIVSDINSQKMDLHVQHQATKDSVDMPVSTIEDNLTNVEASSFVHDTIPKDKETEQLEIVDDFNRFLERQQKQKQKAKQQGTVVLNRADLRITDTEIIQRQEESPIELDYSLEYSPKQADIAKRRLAEKEDRLKEREQKMTTHGSFPLISKGMVIADRYELRRQLGRGTLGAVYLAYDKQREDQKVAIKILPPPQSKNKSVSDRLMKEVKIMRKIQDENVLKVMDVGMSDDIMYYTTEYTSEFSLAYVIEAQKLAFTQIVEIAYGISNGLRAIHAAGVIHRDLHPGNILIAKNNEVIIHHLSESQEEELDGSFLDKSLTGSVGYIAPEVWLGYDQTKCLDMYSMGIIFYEMSTGELPFTSNDSNSLMNKHLEEKPISPKHINPELPDWWEKMVLSLLSKSRADRPNSAEQICDIIRVYAEQSPDLREHLEFSPLDWG